MLSKIHSIKVVKNKTIKLKLTKQKKYNFFILLNFFKFVSSSIAELRMINIFFENRINSDKKWEIEYFKIRF